MADPIEIIDLPNETSPGLADVVYGQLAVGGAGSSKKIEIQNITKSMIFDKDFQRAESLTRSTTTLSTYQTKVSLTGEGLTGTYRVAWMAHIDNNGAQGKFRLRNITDGIDVTGEALFKSSSASDRLPVGGFGFVVFAADTKTFDIQWADVAGGNTQGIQEAKIEFWRVS